MWRGTYQPLFICILSFYISEHAWFVRSRWTNQEMVKETGFAKKYSLGSKAETNFGTMLTITAIAGSSLGIGMMGLPSELSSPEIDSPHRMDIPMIYETTNDLGVFGMHKGTKTMKKSSHRKVKKKETEQIPFEPWLSQESLSKWNQYLAYSQVQKSPRQRTFEWVVNTATDKFHVEQDSSLVDSTHPMVTGNVEFDSYDVAAGESESLTAVCRDQIMESTNDNCKEIQAIEANKAKRGLANGNHTQKPRVIQNRRMITRKGKLGLCLAITGSLLVLGVIITVIVLKTMTINKETPIKILGGVKDAISVQATKTAAQTTTTIGQTTETIGQTTETIGQTTETTVKTTETTVKTTNRQKKQWPTTARKRINVTTRPRLAQKIQKTTQSNIYSAPDICKPYKNMPQICSSDWGKKVFCQSLMADCMNRRINSTSLPTSCHSSVEGISPVEYLYEKLGEILSQGMKYGKNISSLDCAVASKKIQNAIMEMGRIYECRSHYRLLNQLWRSAFNSCLAFKQVELAVKHMCILQQNIKALTPFSNSLRIDIIGAMRRDLQTSFVNCTNRHDTKYFKKHFSLEKDISLEQHFSLDEVLGKSLF